MRTNASTEPTAYDLSLVIACYNEAYTLVESVCEIEKVLEKTPYSYEFIFIDDKSTDNTRELIEEITKDKPNMRYLFHEENVGRGGTVKEGIRLARGRVAGFLDIDLEVHARYITSMMLAIDEGYDVATGHRVYKTSFRLKHLVRDTMSVIYRLIVRKILSLPLLDTETGYKFFNRKKILPLIERTHNNGWFWDTEIMALSYYEGLKMIEIPTLFLRKSNESSTVRVFRDSLVYFIELMKFKRSVSGGKRSLIYSHPAVYNLIMRFIYGKDFKERYRVIAQYVPQGASVVEVCCGDCYLYKNYLRQKDVDYKGLDSNLTFVTQARGEGINATLFDLNNEVLPSADYVIIHASLYQFMPNESEIMDKLFATAAKGVIVAEPIRNLSDSTNPLISFISQRAANPGTGHARNRFNEESLIKLFDCYKDRLQTIVKTKWGREIVGVFKTS